MNRKDIIIATASIAIYIAATFTIIYLATIDAPAEKNSIYGFQTVYYSRGADLAIENIETLNFDDHKFQYTSTWTSSESTEYVHVSGHVMPGLGNHMYMEVEKYSMTKGLSDLLGKLKSPSVLDRQIAFAEDKGSYIRFVRTESESICFYHYNSGGLFCFESS